MKKTICAAAAIAALAVPSVASASAGERNAYGQQIKSEFGKSYGQLLNSVRGNDSHGVTVFPPASGAKWFYENHPSPE